MRYTIPTIFTAVDHFSRPVAHMRDELAGLIRGNADAAKRMNSALEDVSDKSLDTGLQLSAAGAAILGPLGMMTNSAIAFEDGMADIAKTTGLAGSALRAYGEGLLDISNTTRTNIDDLLKIGEIGGQLGVAQADLMNFTKSANQFSVALGSEFSGGVEEAISSVSKLTQLFADTKVLPVSEGITRIGSAINALSATGNATSSNLANFSLRLGALPEALKPATTGVLSLGAFLEEAGLNSEVAASGFQQLLLDASRNMPAFAAQMKIGTDAAQRLLSNDPVRFAADFSSSIKGLSTVDAAGVFKKLSIASGEELKVIGALSTGIDRLTYLQGVSNEEFAKGTSLAAEYATKNSTAAAQLAIARNNMRAFAITTGTELIPMLTAAVKGVMPVVRGVMSWVREHGTLTRVILGTAAAVGGVLVVAGGFNLVVAAATKATVLWNAALAGTQFVAGLLAPLTGTLNGAILATGPAARGAALGMTIMNTTAQGLLATFTSLAAVVLPLIAAWKLWDMRGAHERKLDFMQANLPAGVDKKAFRQQFDDFLMPGFIGLNYLEGARTIPGNKAIYDSLDKMYEQRKQREDSLLQTMNSGMSDMLGAAPADVRVAPVEVTINNNSDSNVSVRGGGGDGNGVRIKSTTGRWMQ